MKRPHVYRDGLRGILTDDGRFAPGVTSIRHPQSGPGGAGYVPRP